MPGMDGFISFNGTLQGGIEGGSGGDVADVKVRHSQSTDYESVVNPEKIALIDLISYVRRNELAQDLMVLKDNFDLKLTYKQNNLTAGDNITIENNVISATGGSNINYSYEEQATGQKWTDNKDLFVKTFRGQLTISTKNRTWYNLINNLSYMDKVFVMPESFIELSDAIINLPYTSYYSNTGAVVGVNFDTPTHTFQLLIGGLPTGTYNYEITLKYTKTV